MQQIKLNVYKYDELNDKAKARAINDYNKDNEHPFLTDDLEYNLKTKLEEKSITINKLEIFYSLGHSQGDGFSFAGVFEFEGVRVHVDKVTHHYQHYNTVTHSAIDDEGNNTELPHLWVDLYKDICREMEKIGYDIIEHEESEDYIKESFDANDYLFLENGDVAPRGVD